MDLIFAVFLVSLGAFFGFPIGAAFKRRQLLNRFSMQLTGLQIENDRLASMLAGRRVVPTPVKAAHDRLDAILDSEFLDEK